MMNIEEGNHKIIMDMFKIKFSEMKRVTNELYKFKENIVGYQSELERIHKSLRKKIVCEEQIGKRLSELLVVMGKIHNDMEITGEKLETIYYLYDKTEKMITGDHIEWKIGNTVFGSAMDVLEDGAKNIMDSLNLDAENTEASKVVETVLHGNPKVFDEDGLYGGNQKAPAKLSEDTESDEWSALVKIMRETFPDIKDPEETKALMKKLEHEGCGYVAMVNMIFIEYEGREDDFLDDFGFPMNKNGDLNFNELLVDIYCRTDNHNKGITGKDKYKISEDCKYEVDGDGFLYWLDWNNKRTLDETGFGQSCEVMAYRMNLYMKDKGVEKKVKVENVDLSPDPIRYTQLTDGKYIVVSAKNFELFNQDHSSITNGQRVSTDMRHAMIVTGVTDDGRYIVSTFGEKCYLDPNECESMEFYAYSNDYGD